MLPIEHSNFNSELENQIMSARQLVSRLERLSADSIWARRASGYRASLLKSIETLDWMRFHPVSHAHLLQELNLLNQLLEQGYQILDYAGRELIAGRCKTQRDQEKI